MRYTDLIPHAPHVGLYVAPHIPENKLENALGDYAKTLSRAEVLALFDATLMGSAKDGAVFARDRMIFQNNDLQPIHEVRYEDIVQVDARRKLIGGRKVLLTVNRGRATFEIEMDFSGKPQASDFVLRFLREAMLNPGAIGGDADADAQSGSSAPGGEAAAEYAAGTGADHVSAEAPSGTDVEAVSRTLENLRNSGLLSPADYEAMIRVLKR